MSKITLISCIILVTLIAPLIIIPAANASTSTMWSKTYGGSASDRAFSLIKTQDGGYALIGTSFSFSSNGFVNAMIVKTDSDGNLQWNQTYGGLGASYPCAFVQTTDGGYALVGYTYSLDGTSSLNSWFAKTDSAGKLQWNKTYSELGTLISNLVQTPDGGYAIVGYTTMSEEIIYAWLAKTDVDGNIQWKQNYGTTGGNEIFAIIQTSNGSYTLAGYTTSAGAGQEDFWLIRTDSSGTMQWNQTYGSANYDMLSSFVQTADDGYALFGYTTSSNTNSDDFMLVKTDPSGILQWTKTYGGTNIDEAFYGIQTTDNGYALTGVTATINGTGNAWIVKTDTQGNMQWNQTYGNSTENILYAIVQANDGGYVGAGYTNSTVNSQDFWLLKTDENGVVPEFSDLFAVPLFAICTIIVALILRKNITKKHDTPLFPF
jgi:hypothetical protein